MRKELSRQLGVRQGQNPEFVLCVCVWGALMFSLVKLIIQGRATFLGEAGRDQFSQLPLDVLCGPDPPASTSPTQGL